MNKLVIKDWAVADRPREKLLEKGRRFLTDAELLAILIGSGSRDETSVELCKRVLADLNNDLTSLSRMEIRDLCKYKGIGEAKAISIIAAMELGRRRKDVVQPAKPVLNSSKRVYDFFRSQLQDLMHEEFWVLYLTKGCKVLEQQLIGKGGNDFTPVDVRSVLRNALTCGAYSIILIHNHPSGTLKPSKADEQLTKKIVNGASMMDIHVNDHIIFTDNGYFSFRDAGLLD
ncbi:RadC family protein [Sphingobacterium sp. SYP-B4668]|uniref:RadC family protein n=1 Tax=Sphingobacterium sp. SYP-B4668 TaxID=2996035 RepID=UPI0022DDD89D|nr:DNA repair protein RadC [Sphingobacterium sp. SYP-B4668]